MAKEHRFAARLSWRGTHTGPGVSYESYGRDYVADAPGKPQLAGSGPAVFHGDDRRWSPEDLVVVSLSACHMLTYLALAARAGIRVLAYEDDASATLAMKDGKMRFVDAQLRPAVRVERADQASAARELHEKAHAGCFVANSVNFPVRLEPQVTS